MEIIYCKDCVYWKPRHIKKDDGTERAYTENDGDFVSIDEGINVGAQCFVEHNRGWNVDKTVYREETDFCSRARRGDNFPLKTV